MQREAEESSNKQLSADMCYKYEELRSRPSITPDSDIPENLLHLSYPSLKISFVRHSSRRGSSHFLSPYVANPHSFSSSVVRQVIHMLLVVKRSPVADCGASSDLIIIFSPVCLSVCLFVCQQVYYKTN